VRPFLLSLLLCTAAAPLFSYDILYAEQYYRLYHDHFHRYPEDTLENIWYLEKALSSDFANPLNALAVIENKREWEHYRILFYMHVNVKLTELYLTLGSKYDRMNAYFYNYPWKQKNLKSLEKAKRIYSMAYYYWEEAVRWAQRLRPSYIHLEDIQYWEDEHDRIVEGDLDYKEIIDSHIARLEEVQRQFEEMDPSTY
jgi:hypothetical protein